SQTGQVSAYCVVQSLESPTYPLVLQKLGFLCILERTLTDPAQCTAEFSITLDGKQFARDLINIDFGTLLRNTVTARLESLVLDKPGSLVFRLAIPGQDAGEWVVVARAAPSVTARPANETPTEPKRVWDSGQLLTAT